MRLLLLLLLTLPLPSRAQSWRESFADGDLTANPAWSGDFATWAIRPAGADAMLFSAGPEASDTLALETASEVAYGTWRFLAGYTAGSLSNFNLARIYLLAGAGGALHEAASYSIQLGSNDREIRLYHTALGGERTLLGRAPLPDLDDATLRLSVERSLDTGWRVMSADTLLFAAPDAGEVPAVRFGLWVKHTRTRGQDFFFDDLEAEAGAPPQPDPVLPPGAVVINEIHFAPSPAEAEFIELHNPTLASINLRGLTIADATNKPVPVVGGDQFVEAGGFRVLVRDSASFSAVFPGVPALPVPGWPSLNNDADAVVLGAGGVEVDRVVYLASRGVPGRSLERKDPAGPSDAAGNWAASTDPLGASPGRQNSQYGPDRVPPRLLMAERIDSLLVMTFWDEEVEPAPPGAFRVGSQEALRVDRLGASRLLLTFAGALEDAPLEVTGVADRTGNSTAPQEAPLARRPARGDLVVNELLFEPLADAFDGRPDQPEYVELINRSPYWMSPRGLRLLGPEDEAGAADTLAAADVFHPIPPGGLALLYAGRGGDLWAAFPAMPREGVALLPLEATTLGLDNAGDVVRVYGPEGIVDSLAYRSDWHYPLLAETRGIALERRRVDVPADLAGAWSSSTDPEGGTPGRPNAIASLPEQASPEAALTIEPRVFSPDGDGIDDVMYLRFRPRGTPAHLRLRVYDREGYPVRTLEPGTIAGAEWVSMWDGRDERGARVHIGVYIILVETFYADTRRSRTYKATVVVAKPL